MRGLPLPPPGEREQNALRLRDPWADEWAVEIEQRRPGREAVEDELDRIRPGLVADGGNVELREVEANGTVRVELQGACATCPARFATLRVAIEEPLRKAVPGVTSVIAV